MAEIDRRQFLKSAAVTAGAAALGQRVAHAGDAASPRPPRERANILYGLSTGSWGRVIEPGKPLPLLKILDETAAGGFNGVRLTGFPSLLEANGLTLEQYGEELAKRGLRFSTVSFGGQYFDPQQHADIRARAAAALAAHRKYGANAMVFFPPGLVAGTEESQAL